MAWSTTTGSSGAGGGLGGAEGELNEAQAECVDEAGAAEVEGYAGGGRRRRGHRSGRDAAGGGAED
jgi:hypothetical protein